MKKGVASQLLFFVVPGVPRLAIGASLFDLCQKIASLFDLRNNKIPLAQLAQVFLTCVKELQVFSTCEIIKSFYL